MDLANFARDEDAIEEGTWIDTGNDSRLKIRYFKNEDMVKFARKLQNNQNIPESVQDGLSQSQLREAVARHVLVDWENVKINDEEIEYSTENCKKVLKEFPEFFDMVIELAQDFENFKAEQQDVDVENL